MAKKNEEQWNKIIEYYENGYNCSDISNMIGLTRQRVNDILIAYQKRNELSDYQLEMLDSVVFPEIKKYLAREKIDIVRFCKDIKGSEKDYRSVKYFLLGKTKNTSVEMVSKILKYTGMTFEEAFMAEDKE